MARSTKDPRIALERLAEALGATLEKTGPQTWRVVLPTSIGGRLFGEITPRTSKRALARLVTHALTSEEHGGAGWQEEEVRDTIRLRRIPSTSGLKAHELDAIRRVLYRPDS